MLYFVFVYWHLDEESWLEDQDSGFRNRTIKHSLKTRQLILGYRGSTKIHKTRGTPPSTLRQPWHYLNIWGHLRGNFPALVQAKNLESSRLRAVREGVCCSMAWSQRRQRLKEVWRLESRSSSPLVTSSSSYCTPGYSWVQNEHEKEDVTEAHSETSRLPLKFPSSAGHFWRSGG